MVRQKLLSHFEDMWSSLNQVALQAPVCKIGNPVHLLDNLWVGLWYTAIVIALTCQKKKEIDFRMETKTTKSEHTHLIKTSVTNL